MSYHIYSRTHAAQAGNKESANEKLKKWTEEDAENQFYGRPLQHVNEMQQQITKVAHEYHVTEFVVQTQVRKWRDNHMHFLNATQQMRSFKLPSGNPYLIEIQ